MKKKTVFIICCLFGIISVKNVYDALMTKTLRTTCAGTSASITAIYYTHETTNGVHAIRNKQASSLTRSLS